jgi:hypothetical protein
LEVQHLLAGGVFGERGPDSDGDFLVAGGAGEVPDSEF